MADALKQAKKKLFKSGSPDQQRRAEEFADEFVKALNSTPEAEQGKPQPKG